MKKRIFPRALAYAICATFALTTAALGQNVQVRSDSKESKEIPVTQEPEPLVHFLFETGYTSEYNFRGTNLMPESDGGMFLQGQATAKAGPGTFTFGAYYIQQLGDSVSDAWSISEGGGGAGISRQAVPLVGGGFINADRFPTTTQTRFREVDIFASYKFPLGPIDVTFGNIIFLIQREAQTFELDILQNGFIFVNPPTGTPFATFGPLRTVENETFDRIYIRLSTTKLCPHITPSITYYQTLYNEGKEPTNPLVNVLDQFGNTITNFPGPVGERNDELGGYLEGKLSGNFPVGRWLDINPYALVSVSFKDRTEPVAGTFGGRPLTGFNHAQGGLELNIHIADHVDISPQMAYAYHISEPPIGTDRNEFWGGVKVSVSLP